MTMQPQPTASVAPRMNKVLGAAALSLAGEVGQLAPGFSADLALFDAEDVRELPYWYGDRLCRGTWMRGAMCHPFEEGVPNASPAPAVAVPHTTSEPPTR